MTGSGTTAADGTQTNTFDTAFSAAPKISVVQTGVALSVTNSITSITTSNFVYVPFKAAVAYHYIAIGAP